MIPRKIHYCWVGGKPLPEKFRRYIDSWRRFMPDAEIIEWNERNYDFTKNAYMAAAYHAQKWGFVPDYARLDIIYEHGGIYLDTDVEMVRSLDPLLQQEAFCGFEEKGHVNFGLAFAAVPGHPVIKRLRDSYDEQRFKNPDGSLNLTPSPALQTEALKRIGLHPDDGKVQDVMGLRVYPRDYFAPQDFFGNLHLTENTYTIHHYAATWMPLRWKIQTYLREKSERFLGDAITRQLVRVKRLIWPKWK